MFSTFTKFGRVPTSQSYVGPSLYQRKTIIPHLSKIDHPSLYQLLTFFLDFNEYFCFSPCQKSDKYTRSIKITETHAINLNFTLNDQHKLFGNSVNLYFAISILFSKYKVYFYHAMTIRFT